MSAGTGDTETLAQGYTLVNNTQFSAGQFLLSRLGDLQGAHVLDVGCGPGDLTAHIADAVGASGTVVGIDPSSERIAIANKLARANLSFHEGVAEDLKIFPDGSFDVLYVNSTFHWVGDQQAAIEQFHRVLRPGGRLGISGASGDFVAIHETIKADVLSREPYCNYPQERGPKFLKRREMEDLLDAAGFARRDLVINQIIKSAKDGEAMIQWLDTSSSGKTYGGIPLDMRPRAKEEMKKEWEAYTTESGIRMEMNLLVTVAYKA